MAGSESLDPARWRRVSAVLDQVLEVPVAERDRCLDQICGNDVTCRREVEELLAAADRAGDLLETPAAKMAAPLLHAAAMIDADGRVGTQVGPYRLVRVLGEGGMGVVYLGERADGQFEQRVAIKVLRHALRDRGARARFAAERQMLARLQYPGIARLIDGGVTDDGRLPYFAMEYVAGETITDYCERRHVDLQARVGLFLQVCETVDYATAPSSFIAT
jgi:serine/threonine protein kinase